MYQSARYQAGGPVASGQSLSGQANGIIKCGMVNFTGKNINATNGSRTYITTCPVVGDTLVMDPYGFDTGIGNDFTQPQTSYLHYRKAVILSVTPQVNPNKPTTGLTADTNSVTQSFTGQVFVAFDMIAVPVNTDGSGTNIALGDLLMVQNGSYRLVSATGYPASANSQANWKATQACCAIALAASTTAGAQILASYGIGQCI